MENNSILQEPEINYMARRDSVLLQTEYGSIYITYDTTAKMFDWLKQDNIESSSTHNIYKNYISHIQSNYKISLKHFKLKGLNQKWSSIYLFNGNFCLYSPSDWMSNTGILLTDSIYYTVRSADPGLRLIINYESPSPVIHHYQTIGYQGDINYITITLIDKEKGVAIWEYLNKHKTLERRELKVEAEKVKQFPMLVEDCGDNKCIFPKPPFFFEQPDFEELLKNVR